MFYRDTLRDLDEGDMCSDTSDAPNEPPKIAKRKAEQRSMAAQGRVPTLDLLSIWDAGASQGMVDKAVVSSKNAFIGDEVSISTGNGTISSKRYERCEIAPGVPQVHVALPNTANTVSMGSINTECRVGFQWLQPLSQSIGCAFGVQALAPTDIDATLHAQLCATSPSYKEHHAKCKNGKWFPSPYSPIKQGAIHYDGIFRFFPCRIAARTPERLDSDPVITLCLSCCSSPDSCGCGRQSLEDKLQQELIAQGYSESFMFSPGPHRHGAPAKLFPKHSVSSSYVPP